MRGPDVDPASTFGGSSRVRRWLGAVAILLLSTLFAWPFVRRHIAGGDWLEAKAIAPAVSAKAASEDKAPAKQLQTASEALKRSARAFASATSARGSEADNSGQPPTTPLELRQTSTPATSASAPAAQPSDIDEATACIESFLPEGTFGRGRLDWVCEQPNLWSIELDLYGRAVSRGTGPGVSLWVKLGRFELGAIAILRTACCPNAAPFTAKVPVRNCGSLDEVLLALGKQPSSEHAHRYDETMTCLAERKVWFPEGWSRVTYKQSRQHFDEFLQAVRKRN